MIIICRKYSRRRDKIVFSLRNTIINILGAGISGVYFAMTGFNKAKAVKYHIEKNPFALYIQKIEKKHNAYADYFRCKILPGIYDNNIAALKIAGPAGIAFLPWNDEIADKITNEMAVVYEDTFKVFAEYQDNYSIKLIDKLEKDMPEGTYCLWDEENNINIAILPEFTVIDAGAWIGDFSAYASCKGAIVHAFEPSPDTFELLKRTAEMNGNIIPVQKGLGDAESFCTIHENECLGSGNSFIFGDNEGTKVEITTLDNYVSENQIKKIDFIKADIEGSERDMLKGANRVLREHQPILSICTYHKKDDPEVLEALITSINPKYKIIQRKKKLFAWVPQS